MKKILYSLACVGILASNLSANIDKQYILNKLQNANISNKELFADNLSSVFIENGLDYLELSDFTTVSGLNDIVIFQISDESQNNALMFSTKDGKLVFMGNVLANEKNIEKVRKLYQKVSAEQETKTSKSLYNISKIVPETEKIILKSLSPSGKIIMLTDPECPYCLKEIEKLTNYLQEYDVELIFTPVHQKTAFIKSKFLLREIKKLQEEKKSNAEIIELLNLIYTNGYSIPNEFTQEDIDSIETYKRIIFNETGIKAVPTMFFYSKTMMDRYDKEEQEKTEVATEVTKKD